MPETLGKNLSDYIAQHLVAVAYSVKEAGSWRSHAGSAFIVEIGETWLLITAGHVIRDMEEKRAAGRFQAKLVDGMGMNARFKDPLTLPFDYLARASVGNEDDIDYGFMVLDEITKAGLMANGIKPITAKEWQNPPEQFDRLWMIGVPAEIMAQSDGGFLFKALLLNVMPKPHPPQCLVKPFPLIYGTIDLAPTAVEGLPALTHIQGMSGGPLFGVQFVKGGVKYWAVGVQSGWHEPSHTIAACPFKVFADLLKREFET